MDDWHPVQVKQKDKAGRPDIGDFEAMMMCEDRPKGFSSPSLSPPAPYRDRPLFPAIGQGDRAADRP